ncbi:sex-determining region Y protein-like [Calliphora vicina]|uniref:sex-determining region Y protein-like n=1 Tax=Calliphora vicina TaxID=7373 RepID=UPI00325A59D1
MKPERRRDIVERLGYCTNYLARSHNIRSCTSMESCIKCKQLHHTMLHPSRTRSPSPNLSTVSSQRGRDAETQIQPHQQPHQHHHHHRQHRHHQPRQPHHRRHQRQQPHHRCHQRQQPHHRRHQRQHPHQQQRHQIQRQQNQQRQRQQSPAPIASSTTPPMPDQRILAEAIKSLANVLCYQNKPE